jgi:hypothetical protein
LRETVARAGGSVLGGGGKKVENENQARELRPSPTLPATMATSSSPGSSKTAAFWMDALKNFKQWGIVFLLSFALQYLYYGHLQHQQQTSSPTFAIVRNAFLPGGSPWKSFPGSFRLTPAFPDQASRYDLLTFVPNSGDFDVMEIKGQFPHARYFGINLYDANEATDFASLADREIMPDAGSRNPFALDEQHDRKSIANEHRSYTIWLVPERKVSRLLEERGTHHVNIMTYPDGIATMAYMNRVYRSNHGQNLLGGVPLPTVEVFKLDGTTATSPHLLPHFRQAVQDARGKLQMFLFNSDFITGWQLSRKFADRRVVFHRVSDAGLFPNAHMEYVVASLDQDYWNKVAVITMKRAPTADDTYNGGDFRHDVQVRYWSFCVGDLAVTGTPDCLCDDQIQRNPDGASVTIVIAPKSLKAKIRQAGLNYMAWGLATYKPVLIHRHLLAAHDFVGKIDNVPAIGRPPEEQYRNADYFERNGAEHYMGDYAPKGKILDVQDFLAGLENGDFHVAFD